MPELLADGPSIPVHLMNELDSGKVAFFCGAGVSAGPGSGLPGFGDLVEHVYKANRMEPDAVEREALDLEEPDASRRQPKFDKALGLLERQERLGAVALRESVMERLSRPRTGPLSVHEALIALSRRERGVRLITTNFDNRFVEAGLNEELIDAAPKLPVPKPHNWSSVVHLHGRIMPDDDGSNLVLTAADFGRAYLTEQWAARFVTELFREFTIVFVGYSVSDPVMSYMVDALAAERGKGARFATAYAFADHDGSPVGKQKARDGWLAKNVVPILYDRRDEHRLLGDTLIEWARIRNDPFQARSQIAINEITKLPSGPDDPAVERVVWALQDPVAAKALADEPPIQEEADFAKLEKWLEMFADKGLLCCAAADANPGAGDQDPAFVRLVDSGLRLGNPRSLDQTRAHLARWMANHLHVPGLLAWVVRTGGQMHPGLRHEVQRRLADGEMRIPPRLRLLWTILSKNEPDDPWRFIWTSDLHGAANSELERHRIEDEAIECFAPRLVVRPGPGSRLAFQQYFEGKVQSIPAVDACGHLKLVSGDEDTRHQMKDVLENPAVLARHAERLTGYLEQALALGVEDDEVSEASYLYRPSIAAHEQNREHDGWTHLIDLVRDSYFALAASDRARGDNLLRRWVLSKQPLFKRLALHALSDNAKSDIQLVEKLLIKGRRPGVWEFDLRREVLRLMRLAGSRLPRSLRAELVRVIHAGPRSKPGRSLPPERIRHEKALRLRKLAESGARLDKRSRVLADEGARDPEDGVEDRDEFLSWHSEGRWVSVEEFAPNELLEGSVDGVVAILENEEVDRDAYRGFVASQPVKAASALVGLAERGKWPASLWQGFLWEVAREGEGSNDDSGLQEEVARLLAMAPDELFAGVGSAAADFVKDLAEGYGTDREGELAILWFKAWSGIGGSERENGELDDVLTDALNDAAGKLAEAALIRLWKYETKAGEGLPPSVGPYFDAIGLEPDGQLGRVMLATRLYHLFAIDPGWVREHLIARLDPGRSEESAALWSAYGWSPNVGPDLLRAFKQQFLEMLCDGPAVGRREGNLTGLFMSICFEAPGELTAEEIHRVVGSMSEEAMKTALLCLGNRLRGDGEERARIWREKAHGWLREYWPRQAARNTAGTSLSMLQLLVECGDAFPDAVAWSLPYLRPLDGHGLYRLGRNEHVTQHPDSMLDLLDRVTVEDVLPDHQRYSLHEVLNELRVARPALRADDRFQRLFQLATR